MKIALDYDHTYSADPEFWDGFVNLARMRGHDIRVVTARDDRFDRTGRLVQLEYKLPVIYCRGIGKKWYCERFVDDFVPDVWIDDRPESVTANSTNPVAGLAEWRATRDEGPSL